MSFGPSDPDVDANSTLHAGEDENRAWRLLVSRLAAFSVSESESVQPPEYCVPRWLAGPSTAQDLSCLPGHFDLSIKVLVREH